MPYHLEIDDRYWEMRFPDWKATDDKTRRELIGKELERLSNWVNQEGPSLMASPKRFDGKTNEAARMMTWYHLPPDSMGVSLIAAERSEQVERHGHVAKHDDTLDGGQLEYAARAVLGEDFDLWPKEMDQHCFLHATEKDTLGRLAVAGSLIAAEMDRILRARKEQPWAGQQETLPANGTRVVVRTGIHERLLRAGMDPAHAEQCTSHERRVYRVLTSRRDEHNVVWLRLHEALELPLNCCKVLELVPEVNMEIPNEA